MTGPDLDRYLKDTIQNDDITKIGTYDKDTDDVILHLCPSGCGGPIIGHLYDDDDNCLRKASLDHDNYTDEKSKSCKKTSRTCPPGTKLRCSGSLTKQNVHVTCALQHAQTCSFYTIT